MSPRSNRKTNTWSAVNFKKYLTSMSCKLESAMWSRDTGQRIPCFDRFQLIITWMSNIKEVHSKPRLHVSANLLFGVWQPSCAITMRKSTHGFPSVSHICRSFAAKFCNRYYKMRKTYYKMCRCYKIRQNYAIYSP